MALRNIGANFEHYRVVEFDKFAIASYNAIHGTHFETTDIRDLKGIDLGIEDVKRFTYLLTYSFPCQDLSVAGKQRGMTKGSNTRSGLLWEVERLLNECKELPQVLLLENVPQVHGKKNMDDFQKWIDFLKSKGYSNFWQDLNARDYGVAQNRNRCFMVSILGDYTYKFPEPIPLDKTMKDYLDDEVDDRFYITSEKAKKLIDKLLMENKILTDRQTDRQTEQQLTLQSKNLELSTKQTALKQDMMMESQTCKQMEPVLLSGMSSEKYEPDAKKIEIALTLLARDYKGLSNFGTNGVVECKKIT